MACGNQLIRPWYPTPQPRALFMPTSIPTPHVASPLSVVSNDVHGIPVLVETVGLREKLARESLADLQHTIRRELE